MKIVKRYSIIGENIALSCDEPKLIQFALSMGVSNPKTAIVDVPTFEDGDMVKVSLCFNSIEDENGIVTEGVWEDVAGIFHLPEGSDCCGWLAGTDGKHIQSMHAYMNYNGFPYRNARLVTQIENNTRVQMLLKEREDRHVRELKERLDAFRKLHTEESEADHKSGRALKEHISSITKRLPIELQNELAMESPMFSAFTELNLDLLESKIYASILDQSLEVIERFLKEQGKLEERQAFIVSTEPQILKTSSSFLNAVKERKKQSYNKDTIINYKEQDSFRGG